MAGDAEPGVLPSGVVTFLFTDIEGSTRRWESDPEVMRAALADHDEVLRAAIDAHSGFLFKHTGDGVCAVFTSPRAAVDAAVAAQRALELPVRMGISTGEAEVRGGDYFGAVLNRAARVMAAGHGGQILLDGTTAGLISGVEVVDLGPRHLRDLATAVAMFQLRAPGLRADFPPLRTLDRSPGNLRPPASTIIGRESELGEVEAVLRAHRLVTLTGVGGVGKTRLAVEVAGRLAPEFPDGVWLFELAAVSDPAAVPDAVAAVLGITQQPGRTLTDSVAAALEGRHRLLVFDNCEHLLDPTAEIVEAILEHSATVTVLTTSREGIGVPDEQLWPVPALPVNTGTGSAAVELFVHRARQVAPRFAITHDDEAAAVVEICRRLDGIPLAIELAASRMASMTPGEVRDRLDRRFQLLVGSRRALQRHHTLRHAVQWSYDLLDDAEKTLLERCSVFAGGFDLESACAVTGSDEPGDFAVMDRLDALVRKSLLVADRSSRRTRFSMLETIREFAEEKLVASDSATEARTRHSRHFAKRETETLALWDSPRQREAYTWLTIELPNLRVAFRWAADNGDLDTAAAIAFYTAFIGPWAEYYEPITWAEELIEPARAAEHPRLADLYGTAAQCWMPGRVEDAVRYSEAAQSVTAAAHPHSFQYPGLLGNAFLMIGQPERSVHWARDQLARDGETRSSRYVATRVSLIIALLLAGRGDEALLAADGLIKAAEATQNPYVLSMALFAGGFAFLDADPDGARNALRRGLEIARDSGNRANETHLTSLLARHEAQYGEPLTALEYAGLAIRNYRDAGDTSIIRATLGILTTLLDRLGHLEPAATIAGSAFTPLTATAMPAFNSAITHLRSVLGDESYETFTRAGKAMSTAAMAAYAFDQIDQARAQLQGAD